MKYDFQLIFALIGFGLAFKKLNWKGWFAVSLLLIGWMAYNVWKG